MVANSKDYKKEWFAKARIDYFSPFLNLWLACNSWYNFHYSLKLDRDHVDKIKTDFGSSNKLYSTFQHLYANGESKDERTFLSLLELLSFSLNQAALRPAKFHPNKQLNFNCLLMEFSKKTDPTQYLDIVIPNALTKTGVLKANKSGIILSQNLVLSDDSEKVFAGLIELIYQVRCALVHGELEPTPTNHEVVKYCYLVLYELMRGFCE